MLVVASDRFSLDKLATAPRKVVSMDGAMDDASVAIVAVDVMSAAICFRSANADGVARFGPLLSVVLLVEAAVAQSAKVGMLLSILSWSM